MSALAPQGLQGQTQGHKSADDGRRFWCRRRPAGRRSPASRCARPRALSVHHRPERPADEPLDFRGPTPHPAANALPHGAGAGGPGQHGIFRRDPAGAFAAIRKGGTSSGTNAAHSTRVRPQVTSPEPSAKSR